MLIAHASDLHGTYKVLETVTGHDLWVLTGDMLPTFGRGRTGRIGPELEIRHQAAWWKHKDASIMRRLGGKPVVVVNGNHDFLNLAELLKKSGYQGEVFDISKGPANFGGQVFAGDRAIPYLDGEWMGETHIFRDIVEGIFTSDPTILVTHAPPSGILDEGEYGHGHGISELTTALTYRSHHITHHFFGHVHEQGGKRLSAMGVTFVNSATCIQMVDV
mgnify:CR=1 FL=1